LLHFTSARCFWPLLSRRFAAAWLPSFFVWEQPVWREGRSPKFSLTEVECLVFWGIVSAAAAAAAARQLEVCRRAPVSASSAHLDAQFALTIFVGTVKTAGKEHRYCDCFFSLIMHGPCFGCMPRPAVACVLCCELVSLMASTVAFLGVHIEKSPSSDSTDATREAALTSFETTRIHHRIPNATDLLVITW